MFYYSSGNSRVVCEDRLVRCEDSLSSFRYCCHSVSNMDASCVVLVDQMDLGFSWNVEEGHVVKHDRFVKSWVEGLEIVQVSDP